MRQHGDAGLAVGFFLKANPKPESVNHTYNSSLVDIEFPLEAWAGKKASFWLEINGFNPSASRNWACWVSAQILR